MKVAVLVPAYNAARYLNACLDSICAARECLKRPSTLDIFCCDDGSTDATRACLVDYAAHHAGVHISSQENRGVVATRNRLLDELPPDYDAFAFVDSDDFVSPEMYATLIDALERTDADVAECGMPGNAVAEERVIDDLSLYVLRRTAPGPWINVVNKLYRRRAVGSLRFREGLRFEEDFFFNYEVHAAIRRKVLVPGVYYAYRDNPDSATHALDFVRYFDSTTRRIRLSLEVFLKAGRIPKALECAWRSELSRDAIRMCLRKNLKKNPDAVQRRDLFLQARAFFVSLARDEGFSLTGLEGMEKILYQVCRRGNYPLARMLVALT